MCRSIVRIQLDDAYPFGKAVVYKAKKSWPKGCALIEPRLNENGDWVSPPFLESFHGKVVLLDHGPHAGHYQVTKNGVIMYSLARPPAQTLPGMMGKSIFQNLSTYVEKRVYFIFI